MSAWHGDPFISGLDVKEKAGEVLVLNEATGQITVEKFMAEETTNDPAENIAAGAVKYDVGKSPIFRGLIDYFPRSCKAVAEVSNFGASKYAWKGWEQVPDGQSRYTDALMRHLVDECTGEDRAGDSGLLHAAHVAWNALARLELKLKDQAIGG